MVGLHSVHCKCALCRVLTNLVCRIDWQQGGTAGHASGGKENPTIWLNKVRATDNIRRNATDRGMVLARWGGLGNHRYQVGFSGDVATVNWYVSFVVRHTCLHLPASSPGPTLHISRTSR